MKIQILIIAMLLATVYTQAVVAKKPHAKAKVSIKAKPHVKAHVKVHAKPHVKAKLHIKKPAVKGKVGLKIKAKVPKTKLKIKVGGKAKVHGKVHAKAHIKVKVPKIKIGVKGKTGAKVHVKVAPKLNLTGSCPAAKMFKSLTVLPKPIAYKSQNMCKGLKTGCCSEASLNKFKADWPKWVKMKSAFFWTLSKWPQGLAIILRNQAKNLKCKFGGPAPHVKIHGKTHGKAHGKLKIKVHGKTHKKAHGKLKIKVHKKSHKAPKKGLKLKVKAKAPKVKAKVHVKAKAHKHVRILQALHAKAHAKVHIKKPSLKVKLHAPKVGLHMRAGMKAAHKAGLKMRAGMKAAHKVGLKMRAGMHKAGLKIKAGMHKAGLKWKAGMKKFAHNAHKVGLKWKAGMKKVGAHMKANWKAGMHAAHKAGLKIRAGMHKAGLKIKAGAAKLRIRVKKFLKITKPSQFMAGTMCAPAFKKAWKMTMPFMRMRKAAAALGLKCFKAVAKARSSAVCAACDNTMASRFLSGKTFGGKVYSDIISSCAPFISWVGSSFKVLGAVSAYAMTTTMKRPLTFNMAAMWAEANKWKWGLSPCFAGHHRRLQALKVHGKAHAKVHGKAHLKVKVHKPKLGLKIRAGAHKLAHKAHKVGLKIRAGAHKLAHKAHKVGLKIRAGAHKAGLKIKAGMKKFAHNAHKVGLKLKAGMHKAGLKLKAGLHGKAHLKIKVHKKKVHGPMFFIGVEGWQLKAGQKLKSLEGSFKSYEKAAQAPVWTGKVNAACKASPFVMEMVKRLITWETADDIKWSKGFWKLPLELNMAIGRGSNSRFARFIGKKLIGIKKIVKKLKLRIKAGAHKAGLKIKAGMHKAGLKIKAGMKKFAHNAHKAGLKIKAGMKKFAHKAHKVGLKIKAGAKKVAHKMKAGLKLKVHKPKVHLKVHAKPKLHLKVKAKAHHRRMQAVASTGVDLNSKKFVASVPQPTKLEGDGQSSPAKSWMMFAGLTMFVALLLN